MRQILIALLFVPSASASQFWNWTADAQWHNSIGLIQQGSGRGSAFLVSPNHIATAAHCCESSNRAVFILPGGQTIAATVIQRDNTHDVALLQLDRAVTDRKPLPIASQPAPVGAKCIGTGYGGPGNELRHFWTQKLPSGEYSHSSLHGDSGSCILYNGEVVSVVSGGSNTRTFQAEDRSTWTHVFPTIGPDITRYKTAWHYPAPIREFFGGRPTSSGYS